MLEITIGDQELFDDSTNEYIYEKGTTIRLEHSLVSLSKWESKWKKPFIGRKLEDEEVLDYIRCMTITQNVDPSIYKMMTKSDVQKVLSYVDDTMTATTFKDKKGRGSKQTITSELIYYWMVSLGIPIECEKWHLNRLLTLIRVCNVMDAPGKKMSRKDIYKQNAMLNASRRSKSGTRG